MAWKCNKVHHCGVDIFWSLQNREQNVALQQVINFYKDVKSAHIIVTTFLLHYCERWRCYMIYLLLKSLHQVKVLDTVSFLLTLSYTPIVCHTLSEYDCKKIMNLILCPKTITWQKSATFPEWLFSPVFCFFGKSYTWE